MGNKEWKSTWGVMGTVTRNGNANGDEDLLSVVKQYAAQLTHGCIRGQDLFRLMHSSKANDQAFEVDCYSFLTADNYTNNERNNT